MLKLFQNTGFWNNLFQEESTMGTSAEARTFEKVWAMFEETDRQFKETDRRFKETDKKMEETNKMMKETDKRMKETDRRIGELTNRFGELAEHLVAPSILEKFNALGFHFTQSSQNVDIRDPSDSRSCAEIDILLENGDLAIAVEVKSKLLQKDVDRHVERMEVLRGAADKRHDGRKFRGAVAGAIVTNEVKQYALRAGFYVIEQSGDTVKIETSKNFIPREW
jgi:hypothetical protein